MEGLVKWLSIGDRHTKMYLDRCLAPLGLNSSQHMYIPRICDEPGIAQDRLARLFRLHPSNVTRSLAALEKAGYLYREKDPGDKRTSRIYPTEKAREARPLVRQIVDRWQDLVLEPFTPEEREQLVSLLRRAAERAVALAEEREMTE